MTNDEIKDARAAIDYLRIINTWLNIGGYECHANNMANAIIGLIQENAAKDAQIEQISAAYAKVLLREKSLNTNVESAYRKGVRDATEVALKLIDEA